MNITNIFLNRNFVKAVGIILYILSIGLIIFLPNMFKLFGLALFFFMLYITIKQYRWVGPGECLAVERNSKKEALKRGYHLILFEPKIDFIKMKLSLKEISLGPHDFKAATKDNVNLTLDDVAIKVKVKDPVYVAFNFTKFEEKIPGMVRGELRKIIKNLDAEDILRRRDELAGDAKSALIAQLKEQHIELLGIVIKKIIIPPEIEKSIEKMARAKYEMDVKLLEAKTKLELTRNEAEIERILTTATFETINELIDKSGDKVNIPIEFLLGKNYLSVLEKISESKNSKLIVYPSDKEKSLKELYSATKLGDSIKNLNIKGNLDEDKTKNES